MKLLRKRSVDADGNIGFYDLYSDFGRALGSNPTVEDDEVNRLTVAILPLPGGEFYHFGTSRELLSSTLALQNKVVDQRKILQRKVKANPSLFVQNALMGYRLSSDNDNVWVENSSVPASWTLRSDHIITGVPENAWPLDVPSGVCVDIVLGRRCFVGSAPIRTGRSDAWRSRFARHGLDGCSVRTVAKQPRR